MLLRYNQHNSQQTSNNFCYFHTHFCWVQGQKNSINSWKGGEGNLGTGTFMKLGYFYYAFVLGKNKTVSWKIFNDTT